MMEPKKKFLIIEISLAVQRLATNKATGNVGFPARSSNNLFHVIKDYYFSKSFCSNKETAYKVERNHNYSSVEENSTKHFGRAIGLSISAIQFTSSLTMMKGVH